MLIPAENSHQLSRLLIYRILLVQQYRKWYSLRQFYTCTGPPVSCSQSPLLIYVFLQLFQLPKSCVDKSGNLADFRQISYEHLLI
jgi:hypothetical protein